MIPADAAASYLSLLGETQETLAQVLLVEETLYPYLVQASEREEKDDG